MLLPWQKDPGFIITWVEQQGSKFVRVHYFLSDGTRTAIAIESSVFSMDEAERIGRALVGGEKRTGRDVKRGKQVDGPYMVSDDAFSFGRDENGRMLLWYHEKCHEFYLYLQSIGLEFYQWMRENPSYAKVLDGAEGIDAPSRR